MDKKQASGSQLEGEGSYEGTRSYNEHLKQHQQTHDTDELADEARQALEGEEGAELTDAEKRAKGGPKQAGTQNKPLPSKPNKALSNMPQTDRPQPDKH